MSSTGNRTMSNRSRESVGSLEVDDCCVVAVTGRTGNFGLDELRIDGEKWTRLQRHSEPAITQCTAKDFYREDSRCDSGLGYSGPLTECNTEPVPTSKSNYCVLDKWHSDIHEEKKNEPTLSNADDTLNEMNWELIFEQDQEGDTQLHIALMLDGQEDVALAIINLCPNAELLNLQNFRYQTALHVAVVRQLKQAVQALTARGAKLFVCDHNGNTPLHLACQMGQKELAHMMTSRFRSREEKSVLQNIIHHKNYEGLTCCHLAALSEEPDNLFHLTQDCDADINIQEGKRGMTVLHMAAEMNKINLVTFLLHDPDIKINQLTYDGWTALDMANGRHLTDMADLLESNGAVQSEEAEMSSSSSSESSGSFEELEELEEQDLDLFRYLSLATN